MTPAKITIEGDFWDCQIYRGRLYLWYSNGKLRIVNWQALVHSFIEDVTQELALTCAFLDGRFLYGSNSSILFEDKDFKELLTVKFNELISRELQISNSDLVKFTIGEQDNPFKELQTDSEVLNNRIYALTYNGLFSALGHRPVSNKFKVSSKTRKINDFVGFSLKGGKYGRLALSGGEAGLYEYDASNAAIFSELEETENEKFYCVTPKHSSFADFNFLSRYNSSIVKKSFLLLHKWDNSGPKIKPFRVLDREIDEASIFGTDRLNSDAYRSNSVSWGTNEKLYKASDSILEVVDFNNYSETDDFFSAKSTFEFQSWKGKILRGGVSYFGTIIECEFAIVVLMEQDVFFNIPGSATRWRVYPRSLNYENHLHVIFDEKLEIYSFNNDYFRNQKRKKFGIAYSPEQPFGFKRSYFSK
jgi:hypothetical protein